MSEVRAPETPDDWRLRLPARRPIDPRREKGAFGCVSLVLLGGSLMTLVWVNAVVSALRSFTAETFLSAVFLFPFGLIGAFALLLWLWMLLGGRSEFRFTPRRLRVIERLGPLPFFFRSVPLERVSGFRALPFGNGRGCIAFDVEGGAQRRWAIEYPMAVLEEAAADLARRRDVLLKDGPRGPADVEHAEDRLRLNVPARGWRLPYVVGAGVLVVLLLGVTWGVLKDRAPAPALIPWLAGTALAALQILRKVGESHRLELSEASLRMETRDFLRTRVREWPRKDVWGYETERRPDEGPWELRVRLRSGAKELLLGAREVEELDWIASVLRRGWRKQDVKLLASSSAGRGICQVCGDPMEERIVWCRKCRTPHHRECWIYTGMCATFGCREIGYTEN